MGDLLGSPRVAFLFVIFLPRCTESIIMGHPNGGKFKKGENKKKGVLSSFVYPREPWRRTSDAGLRGSGGASRYVNKSMESARFVGCDHTSTKAPDPIRTTKLSLLRR